MPITLANVIKITDKLARMHIALKGVDATPSYGYGDPTLALASDWGFSQAAREMEALFIGDGATEYGMGDIDVVSTATAAIRASRNHANYRTIARTEFAEWFRALDSFCRNAGLTGVTDTRTYLEYYNFGSGGAYTALMCPDFAALWLIVPGYALDAKHIYSPAVTSFGSRAFGGSFSDGSAIDDTLYAGAAIPQVSANALYANVNLSGANATVTVTGDGRSAAGADVTARTWTAVLTAAAAGTYTLVPTVTGDILTDVTGITLPPTMTAGTLTVSGAIPSGRNNPTL